MKARSLLARALGRGGAPLTIAVHAESERARREKAERKAREAFFAGAGPLTPYLAADTDEGFFFVSTRDEGVGRVIFGRRFRKDFAVLDRALAWLAANGVHLPPEPMLVDVGANIGTTTVRALRRHGFGSSVALEPSPTNYLTLRLNLIANGLDERVVALAAAASDVEGRDSLDVSAPNMGSHRLARGIAPPQGPVAVHTVTLDGLAASGLIDRERVGLVWIDTQGHEASVLAGAGSLVDAGVPLVVAIRPVKGDPETARPWDADPAARAAVLPRLRESYTDLVELRKNSSEGERRRHPVEVIETVVDSFRRCQDLLVVRRPRP